jgi:hypothetical protein
MSRLGDGARPSPVSDPDGPVINPVAPAATSSVRPANFCVAVGPFFPQKGHRYAKVRTKHQRRCAAERSRHVADIGGHGSGTLAVVVGDPLSRRVAETERRSAEVDPLRSADARWCRREDRSPRRVQHCPHEQPRRVVRERTEVRLEAENGAASATPVRNRATEAAAVMPPAIRRIFGC